MSTVKSSRYIRILFGLAALAALLSIVWTFVWPYFLSPENSQASAAQFSVQERVAIHSLDHNSYEDFLKAPRKRSKFQNIEFDGGSSGYVIPNSISVKSRFSNTN